MNGYNSISKPYNKIFKQTVIASLYSDFWILPETHCQGNETINLNEFKVYQHNRNGNANRRGSGGIAIAIHNSVLETHEVIAIFRGIDGQIAIKLQNNIN